MHHLIKLMQRHLQAHKTLTRKEAECMEERVKIADALVTLAQEIAERRHVSRMMIESLADQLIPSIDNAGIAAVVQDAVESWAYTYLEVLRGDMGIYDPSDVVERLCGVPLEKYLKVTSAGVEALRPATP